MNVLQLFSTKKLRTLGAIVLLLTFFSANAQFSVKKIEKIKGIQNGFFARFSPDSEKLLFSKRSYHGLWLYSFKSKTITKISDKQGAGFEPQFTTEGNQVAFKYYNFDKKGKRLANYLMADLKTGTTKVLSENRTNSSSLRLQKSTLIFSQNLEMQAINIQTKNNGKLEENFLTAFSDENLNLVIIKEGIKTTLNPLGKEYYIWVSASPKHNKILFNIPTKGSFICDLDGKNLISIGKLNEVKWSADGKYVIGTNDQDDGKRYTKSDIVLYTLLSKEKKVLTEKYDAIALNPDLSADGSKVVFNDENGNIFLMHLN